MFKVSLERRARICIANWAHICKFDDSHNLEAPEGGPSRAAKRDAERAAVQLNAVRRASWPPSVQWCAIASEEPREPIEPNRRRIIRPACRPIGAQPNKQAEPGRELTRGAPEVAPNCPNVCSDVVWPRRLFSLLVQCFACSWMPFGVEEENEGATKRKTAKANCWRGAGRLLVAWASE